MKTLITLSATFSIALAAYGAAVTPGDLLIYRVGTGSGSLGTTAAAVFLDEYTTSGSLVQSFALPSSGASALTAVGNSTTEGVLSLSQNGAMVVFAGYRKDAGLSSPASDLPSVTSRVIGTFLPYGAVLNTDISFADPPAAFANRSATTVDGSSFYVGNSTGVRYIATPGPGAATVLIDSRNSRQVLLNGNTLYAANGSTALTAKIQNYGTLPTVLTTATPMVNLATGDAVNSFAMFDLNPSVAGPDTIYAMSTVEALLRKFTFDGTTWSATGSLSAGPGTAQDITGILTGTGVSLYLTSGTTLSTITDGSGYGGTLAGSLTTLATAGTGTAFRGVVLVPEPSTFALLGLGLAAFVLRRNRR